MSELQDITKQPLTFTSNSLPVSNEDLAKTLAAVNAMSNVVPHTTQLLLEINRSVGILLSDNAKLTKNLEVIDTILRIGNGKPSVVAQIAALQDWQRRCEENEKEKEEQVKERWSTKREDKNIKYNYWVSRGTMGTLVVMVLHELWPLIEKLWK